MKGISPERQMLIMLLLALGFDQITKEGARFFGFTTSFNPGISLGWLGGAAAPEVLTGFTIAVIVFLWYQFRNAWLEHPMIAGLFFGAGLGNVVDRVWYGAVRDWLPLPGTMITNNLADWLLFVAIAAYAVVLIQTGWKVKA